MVRLLLVRHGQTDLNAARRYQGHLPTPLNAVGCAQAEALGRRLAGEPLDAVLSSDLPRALETARAIALHHALGVRCEPRLREIALGGWEGLTFDEIARRDPEAQARWIADPLAVAPPGGETLAALAERLRGVLGEAASLGEGRTVVLVSHGGALQVLLCLALGLSPAAHWQFRLDEASLSELSLYAAGAILSRLNDCHHLEGVER